MCRERCRPSWCIIYSKGRQVGGVVIHLLGGRLLSRLEPRGTRAQGNSSGLDSVPLETRAQRFSEAVCKKAPLNCWALESLETGELEPLEIEPRLLAAILAQVDQLAPRKIPALPPGGLCLTRGARNGGRLFRVCAPSRGFYAQPASPLTDGA